ncbi:MAG: tRNA (adenosine(37)-N6)-threonylcarbamoyltransferase complex ATPase subunit type 1 TsaE [Planctomycetes bacterium]|nr:tRNA (adenosine(37)-N6)-threonylcarbamoyltransferase complex ATPase subunit type 1 TsaE [Planctomycetota bacterium]
MIRVEFLSRSPLETFDLGFHLGQELFSGAVLALIGELGGGKTLFTKGVAAGLGVKDYQRVSSPTFVLQQIYEGRLRIYHYDAYRLVGADQLFALGFDENLSLEGVVVVEWADRVAAAVPGSALTLTFEHREQPQERRIVASGEAGRWGNILKKLKN